MNVKLSSSLSLLSALALLASCHRHHSASATISFNTQQFQEVEPNDSALSPDAIGGIRVGEAFLIDGFVQQNGSPWGNDYFDGFAFVVEEPALIEFTLHAHSSADLDFSIYDPFNDAYIARFEGILNPEYGSVEFPYVGEEFHVVVNSFSGDSAYTLEVVAHPLGSYSGSALAAGASAAEQDASEGGDRSAKSAGRMDDYLASKAPELRTVVVHFDPVHGLILIPILSSSAESSSTDERRASELASED